MGDIAVGGSDLERVLDEEAVRAHLTDLFAEDLDTVHRIYTKDAVLVLPQRGKTIVGRDNIMLARKKNGRRELVKVDIVVGQGDLWLAECIFKQNKRKMMLVSAMAFSDGKIASEREYVCELGAGFGS